MRRRQTLRSGARTPSVQVRTRQTPEVARSLGARACEVAAATSRIIRPWSDHSGCFWHTARGRREPMRTRLVASIEPGLKCEGLRDQAVGVDSVGGARAVALAAFLRPCGLKVDQVKLVSLSSNVGAAMIAGQIRIGVLHTDDVPVLEEQMGKKLAIVSTFKQVAPVSH